MRTLLEIKNHYAQEQGYEDWGDLRDYNQSDGEEMEYYMNEICIRAQKAALECAAENVTTVHHSKQSCDEIVRAVQYTKHSITNEQNLIRCKYKI